MMNLLVTFNDKSDSFTNGVEFGRIWTQMELGHASVSNKGMPIHTANIEVIRAACKEYEYVPHFHEIPGMDEWTYFVGIKKQSTSN